MNGFPHGPTPADIEQGQQDAHEALAGMGGPPGPDRIEILTTALRCTISRTCGMDALATFNEELTRAEVESDPAFGTLPALPGNPDDELIAVCARLREMQAEWQRLYNASPEAGEETETDKAWQAFSAKVWPATDLVNPSDPHPDDLPGRLLDLVATTPEGKEAKAAAVLALHEASLWCDSREDERQMIESLLRDVSGQSYAPVEGMF